MPEPRVIVAGTTADYIELIRKRCPGRALFITDPCERRQAFEAPPPAAEELLVDLQDPDGVLSALRNHLDRWQIRPTGVTCYDCESLELGSHIAGALSLPFPSLAAIEACRDKYRCKNLWRRADVACPPAAIVRHASDVLEFSQRHGLPVIIKPLTGSGSELTFKCNDPKDCRDSVEIIRFRLAKHSNRRMYKVAPVGSHGTDYRGQFVAEAFVAGREFSCDFVLDGNRLKIIRTAAKIFAAHQPLGTTLAYLVPDGVSAELELKTLEHQLLRAARALGLKRAVCMVDFIVREKTAHLLEMTPRPGGDCLPALIRQSCGLDMLELALDFAEGRPPQIPEASAWQPLVGLRLLAAAAGTVSKIDAAALQKNRSVREVYVKARPGHRVTLPPKDYDSRVLGHVIFEPNGLQPIEAQCAEMTAKLTLEIENPDPEEQDCDSASE
jgi:biotin carboxylase